MLIQYDNRGFITHIVQTYAAALRDMLVSQGAAFIEVDQRSISLNPSVNCYVDISGDKPELKIRPVFNISVDKTEILADGSDRAVISGVPAGVIVTVDGIEYDGPEDGSIEVDSEMPATYAISIALWPYRPFAVTINAVAQ